LDGQAAGDRVELLARPLNRRAWRHPAERKQATRTSHILRRDGGEGNPEPLIVGKGKPRRHHPNHDVRLAIDEDRFPDNARVSVITPGPQIVTEQHHRTGTRAIILDGKAVTKNWRRPE
jgi:hypothetical protein